MGSVVVRDVRKSFGKLEVLHGVDLDVPSSGLTAILGPSGCGKTTLLRLIAGFEKPHAGTIHIDGEPVFDERHDLPPERRHIGYVAQEGALFPHLTVEANISFGLSRFGLRGSIRQNAPRTEELLELVGLDLSYVKRYPHQLSGGQQQRVALARALASRPGIVLLDEPFSSLDASLRDGTRRAVAAALASAGATAILVTHDQAEALSMAAQIAIMQEGSISQVGEPTAVYRAPVSLSVAAFLGEAVVLPGVIHGGSADCALGSLPLRPHTLADGPARILIRPEQIVVTDQAQAGGTVGKVEKVTFYGKESTITVRLAGTETPIDGCVLGLFLPGVDEDVSISVLGDVGAYPA